MRNTIVHVITSLNTGGAQRALHNVLQAGLAKNYKSIVVSLTDEGCYGPILKQANVEVYTINMYSVLSFFKMRSILLRHSPNFIQGWMYHGNLIASLVVLLLGKNIPISWNVRQCLYDLKAEKRLTKWVIKLCIRMSSGPCSIIYNSELSRSQHEQLGFCANYSLVIPNGFPLQHFAFSWNFRNDIRHFLKLSEKAVVVGHVGRYHPMKDHQNFLKAAVQVAKRNLQVVFLLLGTNVELSNIELETLIPESLKSRFFLLGETSSVEKYYSAMDLFCLSSNSEAFPNVLGEAMACGLPCVTTNVGDAANIVRDTGIIVPPGDHIALADAIFEMLEKHEDELAYLKYKARKHVEQNFSIENVVGMYQKLYKSLLKNSC